MFPFRRELAKRILSKVCLTLPEPHYSAKVTTSLVLALLSSLQISAAISEESRVFESPSAESRPGDAMAIQHSQDSWISHLVSEARRDLAARLSLEESNIGLVQFEEITWPDSSLGCPHPGMKYPQVPVDGYRILLRAEGRDFAYHGDGQRGPFLCPADPSSRRLPPGPPADT